MRTLRRSPRARPPSTTSWYPSTLATASRGLYVRAYSSSTSPHGPHAPACAAPRPLRACPGDHAEGLDGRQLEPSKNKRRPVFLLEALDTLAADETLSHGRVDLDQQASPRCGGWSRSWRSTVSAMVSSDRTRAVPWHAGHWVRMPRAPSVVFCGSSRRGPAARSPPRRSWCGRCRARPPAWPAPPRGSRPLHVDEVDDDDAADVAQAELAHDLPRGFEVGLGDGLLEALAAGEAPGVDVDHGERLGVVDDEVAAARQRHTPRQRLAICSSMPYASNSGSSPSWSSTRAASSGATRSR